MSWLLSLCLFIPGPDVRTAALGRAVHGLPRAEVGTWEGRWSPADFPEDLKARYGEALAAYQADDMALALHHLQGLLENHPGFPAGLHQLGIVCFRLRRMDDAREAMERFLDHAPEHVGRTRVLGHALHGVGDHAAARVHYARVLKQNPGDGEARFGDALAAWRMGDEGGAREGMTRVLEESPTHPGAAYWAARIAWETEVGEPKSWLALCERAMELGPYDPRPVYLHAQLLLDLGRGEEAAEVRSRFERLDGIARSLRTLEEQLLVAPGDVDLLRRRLQLLVALGDREGIGRARARLLESQRGR